MYLILFFILFGLLGYWLATSRFSRPIDRTAGALVDRPRSWFAQFRASRRRSLSALAPSHPFVLWATGEGAGYFPADFVNLLTSLSPQEADTFASALEDYAQGLGFRLDDLSQESLQARPALMQVYVEALTIYSQAYRKAKQANLAAEQGDEKSLATAPKGTKTNGKLDDKSDPEAVKTAEKALIPAS